MRNDRRPNTVHEGGYRRKRRNLRELRETIEASIPLSPGNYNLTDSLGKWYAQPKIAELEKLAVDYDVDLSHSPKWREQLGSLGGGNHFIELCLDEEDRVWLFLHSGSRGVGNKIAQKHIKVAQQLCKKWHIKLPNRDLAYLPEGIPEFWDYIRELRWAQRFAYLNRAEMMDRFAHVFGQWIGKAVQESERINCHHNYTEREQHYGQTVWLTRKGAISAHEGDRGVIPGSMGTRSYVVVARATSPVSARLHMVPAVDSPGTKRASGSSLRISQSAWKGSSTATAKNGWTKSLTRTRTSTS